MKKLFERISFVLILMLLLSSCQNSKQLACPDYSKDKSVQYRNSQAYKPSTYKAPAAKRNNKIKTVAPDRSEPQVESYIESAVINNTLTEELAIHTEAESLAPKKEETSFIEKTAKLASAKDNVEKFKLSADATTPSGIAVQGSVKPSANIGVSDASVSEPGVKSNERPLSKSELRAAKKELKKEFRTSLRSRLSNGPAMGLAVASLICGIVGFFFAGIILGGLAVIMGATALSRIRANPDQPGKGIAIAGLIIGIISFFGAIIVITAML